MKALIFLTSFLLLLGCNADHGPSSYFEKFYSFEENLSLKVDSTNKDSVIYLIDGGENLVFGYHEAYDPDKNVVDDEYTESLIFEIGSNNSEFTYTGEEVKITNLHYRVNSMNGPRNYTMKSGFLKGTKISEKLWEVEVDVKVDRLFTSPSTKEFKFKKQFEWICPDCK